MGGPRITVESDDSDEHKRNSAKKKRKVKVQWEPTPGGMPKKTEDEQEPADGKLFMFLYQRTRGDRTQRALALALYPGSTVLATSDTLTFRTPSGQEGTHQDLKNCTAGSRGEDMCTNCNLFYLLPQVSGDCLFCQLGLPICRLEKDDTIADTKLEHYLLACASPDVPPVRVSKFNLVIFGGPDSSKCLTDSMRAHRTRFLKDIKDYRDSEGDAENVAEQLLKFLHTPVKYEARNRPPNDGIRNLGNTCWCSSTLQMLATCEEVVKVLQRAHDTNTLDPRLRTLLDILKLLRCGNASNDNRDANKENLSYLVAQFLDQYFGEMMISTSERTTQRCSKEFTSYLLNLFALHPPLAVLFHGTYQKLKVCQACSTRTFGFTQPFVGEPIRTSPDLDTMDIQAELSRQVLNEETPI